MVSEPIRYNLWLLEYEHRECMDALLLLSLIESLSIYTKQYKIKHSWYKSLLDTVIAIWLNHMMFTSLSLLIERLECCFLIAWTLLHKSIYFLYYMIEFYIIDLWYESSERNPYFVDSYTIDLVSKYHSFIWDWFESCVP